MQLCTHLEAQPEQSVKNIAGVHHKIANPCQHMNVASVNAQITTHDYLYLMHTLYSFLGLEG